MTVSPARCTEVAWAGQPYVDRVTEELRAGGVLDVRATSEDGALAATPLGAVWIRIEVAPCSPRATSVELTMVEPLTRATRVREVDVAGTPEVARARAVALEAAELFRAGWTDAAPAPPPASARPTSEAAPTRAAQAGLSEAREGRPPLAATSVGALAEARIYPRGGTGLFGGRLAAGVPLLPWVLGRIDGGVAFGSAPDALGDVSVVAATAGVGLLAVGGSPAVRVGVGPRFELGGAWFSGQPSAPSVRGSTATGSIAALAVTGALSARLSERWSVTLEPECGVAVKTEGASADARLVADLAGPYIALRAGVAMNP